MGLVGSLPIGCRVRCFQIRRLSETILIVHKAYGKSPKLGYGIVEGLDYGPVIWALTCFFLVWVRLKAWPLFGMWYIVGKTGRIPH